MTPQEHGQLIRSLYDDWDKGNIDSIDRVYAQNCSFHDPAFPATGLAAMKEQARQMREAVPDLHMDVYEILADGDLTAARWTMGGTLRGEFQGVPPTGKSFTTSGVVLDKWEGDRIVEEWNSYDATGMLDQLGIDKSLLAQSSSRRATG